MVEEIINLAMEFVPENKRKEFYIEIIGLFEGGDWDTQHECLEIDFLFDEAMKEAHPDWYDNEEEEEYD